MKKIAVCALFIITLVSGCKAKLSVSASQTPSTSEQSSEAPDSDGGAEDTPEQTLTELNTEGFDSVESSQ